MQHRSQMGGGLRRGTSSGASPGGLALMVKQQSSRQMVVGLARPAHSPVLGQTTRLLHMQMAQAALALLQQQAQAGQLRQLAARSRAGAHVAGGLAGSLRGLTPQPSMQWHCLRPQARVKGVTLGWRHRRAEVLQRLCMTL